MSNRQSIRVTFADGNIVDTEINGTEAEIRAYYLGNRFNFGDTDECPRDNVRAAVSVDFLD